jgi:hypothetical protein
MARYSESARRSPRPLTGQLLHADDGTNLVDTLMPLEVPRG